MEDDFVYDKHAIGLSGHLKGGNSQASGGIKG